MSYKLIFFGTSDFAVPSLEALIRDPRCEILGVVTQPDRPVGRHATITPPAVKRHAVGARRAVPLQHAVPIQQPEKLKDEPFASWIQMVGPICDVCVVVSYGKIFPQWLLDLPRKGCVNVHGSLLPRWRGPSPIQAAIAAGDEKTGVTIMQLDAEMDHGPLLAVAEERIRPDDTGGSLHDRLAALGGKLLPETIAAYLEGKLTPFEQDHSRATICKLLIRADGKIDWTKNAEKIERLVRAYHPWPGTWTNVNGQSIKILSARVGAVEVTKQPGEWFIRNDATYVACGQGTALEITSVQPEGKKKMTGAEYARGRLRSPAYNA